MPCDVYSVQADLQCSLIDGCHCILDGPITLILILNLDVKHRLELHRFTKDANIFLYLFNTHDTVC